MATSSREARRRRIAERGSDRLALISGRIKTLPSSSSESPESNHSYTASCPPFIDRDELSHQPIVSHDVEVKSSDPLLQQHKCAGESGLINAYDGGNRAQPVVRKCETSTEPLKAPSRETDEQSSQVIPTVQGSISPTDTDCRREPQLHRSTIFNSNQISAAIKVSESTRFYCSLAAGIIVVLSYLGFPFLGSRIIKSIIFFRPLYLVLVTNVSIVLAQLLSDKQRRLEKTQQKASDVTPAGGNGLAEQVGNALESALMLQNIVSALFMDCSVYAIVVICGLSIVQKLGW